MHSCTILVHGYAPSVPWTRRSNRFPCPFSPFHRYRSCRLTQSLETLVPAHTRNRSVPNPICGAPDRSPVKGTIRSTDAVIASSTHHALSALPACDLCDGTIGLVHCLEEATEADDSGTSDHGGTGFCQCFPPGRHSRMVSLRQCRRKSINSDTD